MKVTEFDYCLPEELIAQEPVEPRDHSRLLVLDRNTGMTEHLIFKDCIKHFRSGDILVVNNTRVIPARLFGQKEGTGARIEVMLLKRLDRDRWEALVRPGKRVKTGTRIVFGGGQLTAEAGEITAAGGRVFSFEYSGIFEEVLDRLGQMPLPPYITRELADKERYQTVYAKNPGSAAAPTAGLHFTPELLAAIKAKGIKVAEVMLHVGLGTFRPVQADNVEEHEMHTEYYEVSEETAAVINEVRVAGGRVVAVGTTAARTMETAALSDGTVAAGSGWTGIFIYPGYRFKVVDMLLTNFHLPKSTLLMLVSAFAGRENILSAYREAVDKRYRFFSFGDAMLLK